MGKQAQRIFLVVVDVRVREGLAARAVVGAVQEGRLVREAPFAEVAAELQADVAVRGETRRIAALYPFHVVRGLKTLESYRRLELAEHKLCGRVELRVHVRVLDDGSALAEVRHDAEVEDACERAFDGRAHARRLERVDDAAADPPQLAA